MQANVPPVPLFADRTFLSRRRKPLKDPDKEADPPPDADITVAGGMRLFSEIEDNYKTLMDTISNVRATSPFLVLQ